MRFRALCLCCFLCPAFLPAYSQPQLDISLNGSGRVATDMGDGTDVANAVLVQPDNKIIAVGVTNLGGSPRLIGLARGRTVVATNGESQAKSVYLRPNGKILLGGYNLVSEQGFVAVAFNPDGSLDTSFNGNGVLIYTFNGYIGVSASAMTVDNLGRPILVGGASTLFAVSRLYTLDPVPVTVGGRTVTPEGIPIRGIRVGLTDASGQTRWAITSPFGSFQFDNVMTGQTCTLQVRGAKRHIFDFRDVGVNEAVSIDLIGKPRPDPKVETKSQYRSR
jgi:uncharacterized delta-60 repeat protein